jgi:hypothetical protein
VVGHLIVALAFEPLSAAVVVVMTFALVDLDAASRAPAVTT